MSPDDPIGRFRQWLAQANACPSIRYAHAACLSTLDDQGAPDSRVVLVHFVDRGGAFVFSTDTRSSKATQLAGDARAALCFDWNAIDRQVRVRGEVTLGDDAASDRCFDERPRGSRITAWASQQSHALDDRHDLLARHAAHDDRLRELDPIPRPATWRAHRLKPNEIEFWHAHRHRLHERRRYTRGEGGWDLTLLDP